MALSGVISAEQLMSFVWWVSFLAGIMHVALYWPIRWSAHSMYIITGF